MTEVWEPVSTLRVDRVQRIAVLRANAIGDLVFTLPALIALRETYPEAEIVLLGRSWHAEFLRHRPGPVDRVIEVPPIPGITAPAGAVTHREAIDHFFADMKSERFDLALQLHGGGRYSNPFVLRLNPRVSAGLRTPDAIPLDRWCDYVYYQHEVLRYLEAVSLVGAVTSSLEPRLHVTESDLAQSYHSQPETNAPLVLLHPGAGDPRRRWPPEKFAAVADALADAGARVLINAIGENLPLAQTISDTATTPTHLLAGPLSLSTLTGLLARCRLVVGNDSGPLHLARAVGTRTVGIYWCGNMVNAAPLMTHRHRTCISWQLHCSECGADYSRSRCEHEHSLVTQVSATDVIDTALTLFAQISRTDTFIRAPGAVA